jgi:hypothetical protein
MQESGGGRRRQIPDYPRIAVLPAFGNVVPDDSPRAAATDEEVAAARDGNAVRCAIG